MKPKTIVTVVILAFVAVAVGYLIVKEVRAARVPEVAAGPSGAAPATAASGDEAPGAESTPSAAERKVTVTYYYTSKR